ncbi:MAG: efflux RND transporter permease subunit [Candidatus Eremiobacteraeota bacterium]|nr:efflux RND transporter permease subunit [Candidatus Eremiobacteraeota bacterium]
MWLTRVFLQRPTLVLVLIAVIMLAGFISLQNLVSQQFPNIEKPVISVRLNYTGASTTEMRDSIVVPIENQIAGTPDLETLDSTVQGGAASITATFALTSDAYTDMVYVQRALQQAARYLPTSLVPPSINLSNPSESTVVTLGVTSKSLSPSALSLIITGVLVPDLEQITGVSNVNAIGTVTPAYEVTVNPQILAGDNLTITDVVNTIQANNTHLPGGTLYAPGRQTALDVRADITDAKSVGDLLIQGTAGTSGVTAAANTTLSSTATNPWTTLKSAHRIADVATVVTSQEPRTTYAAVNGQPSFFLGIQKSADASEVTASNNVLAALPQYERRFPQLAFTVINVQSNYTKQQLDAVIRTLVEGIVFIAVMMLFFLASWRNAVVVLIAIPTSLAVTLAGMKLMNFTIDTVSLLGMTLAIGILIDDSTVVLENIERHRDELGQTPIRAAISGRTEIGMAAMVLTLVDVVVFLPIAFLTDQVGRQLAEFAIVVTIATLTSLFVSFTITPALAGLWALQSDWKPPKFIRAFDNFFLRLRGWYHARALPWALRKPWTVVAIAGFTFALAILAVAVGWVGKEYIPAQDMGQIFVQFTFPVGTPVAHTTEVVQNVEAQLVKIPDLQAMTRVSGAMAASFGGYVAESNVAQIQIFLKPDRKHNTDYWVAQARRIGYRYAPGSKVVVIPSTGTQGGNQQPIDELVSDLSGGDPTDAAQQVLQALQQTPGASNVNSSASALAPQVNVFFNREAARSLDVSISDAANAVNAAFAGALPTQVITSQGIMQIQVIYPLENQHDLSEVESIPVTALNGNIVTVGDVAQLQWAPTLPLITRENRLTVIHVNSNIAGSSLANVQAAFQKRLAALHLPPAIRVAPSAQGQQSQMAQTLSDVGHTMILSLILVFLLMVALYNSYSTPFIIMFSVPVAAVGAVGSLIITHQTLNLFSLIGSMLLIGLVAKNGILLVDYANTLRRRGYSKIDAIQESAQTRFRPIMMTTLAMVAGMLPLALAFEPGSQVRQSLGIVVIGGLLSSLVLTLLLVPVMYEWIAPKELSNREREVAEELAVPTEHEVAPTAQTAR